MTLCAIWVDGWVIPKFDLWHGKTYGDGLIELDLTAFPTKLSRSFSLLMDQTWLLGVCEWVFDALRLVYEKLGMLFNRIIQWKNSHNI